MDWFKLTGLGRDIRPNKNSKKNIATKSPSILATKFVAFKVGVFCNAMDDSICSSTILDVKLTESWGESKTIPRETLTGRHSSFSFSTAVKLRWRPRLIYL